MGNEPPSCRMCHRTKDLQKHHLKPLAQGGQDTPENTVFLCKDCHIRFTDYGSGSAKSTKKSPSPNVSLYVGAYRWYWDRFMEICKREGSSASKKLCEFLVDYVQKHDPGNPQTTIPSYGEGGNATLAGIEGRVRQLCLERITKAGDMTVREVRTIAREEGIKGSQLKPFIDRVTQWLKEQGKKVWQ